MISRLRLRDWRVYERLDLRFQPGATFLVARNAVGKTSLVDAIAWALFGDASGVDAPGSIRAGAGEATAKLDLALPDGRLLSLQRRVRRRGRPVVEATLGEDGLDDNGSIESALSRAFGLDTGTLARLTVLREGALHSNAGRALDLHAQLADVFGVTDLLRAAAAAETASKRTLAETNRIRTYDADLQAVAEMTRRRDELRATAESLQMDRSALAADLAAAELEYADAVRRAEGIEDREKRRSRFVEALRESADFFGRSIPPGELADVLQREKAALDHAISREIEEAADLRARQRAIAEALDALQDSSATCPVCRRPISDDDHGTAAAGHADDLRSIEAELRRVDGSSTKSRRDRIKRLLSEVRAAAPFDWVDDEAAPDVVAARSQMAALRDRLISVDARRLSAVTEANRLATEIETAEEARRATDRVTALYRKSAAAEAAQVALIHAADTIVEQRIDPLSDEIAWRWKRLLGERGNLVLDPAKGVVLRRDEQEIAFPHLSAGEKLIAMLVVRTLMLAASTEAKFMVVDEPLEHLDPRNRAVVASVLTQITGSTTLDQVIATTYEEQIARRLAAATKDVHLVYIHGDTRRGL